MNYLTHFFNAFPFMRVIYENMVFYTLIYFILFLTSLPFVFFCLFEIVSLVKRDKLWDKKRFLLFLNAIIYPFIFIIIFLFLIKLFEVDQELNELNNNIFESSNKTIQGGGSPFSNNALLGSVFASFLYYGASLVPAILISSIYSIGSSIFLVRYKSETKWWIPFLFASVIATIFTILGYIFRTPIFNLLR